MAQEPSDTILVAIQITLRIRGPKSEIRILRITQKIDTSFTNCVMPCSAEVCALWVLLVFPVLSGKCVVTD